MGEHDSLEAGAHGPWQSSVPFSLAGSTEDMDERVGLGPAGKSCFGQWAGPGPMDFIRTFLGSALCMSFLQLPVGAGGSTPGGC